jgi:cysteine desulfurase
MPRFYFDHNATTPIAPEVLEVLVPALREVYGNPSSIHRDGQAARRVFESARRQVACLLSCGTREVVFTSGGTEADNLAILGSARGGHVITTAIEHPAVLTTCRQLERAGVGVTYVRPSPAGVIDPDDIRKALRPDTRLISVMQANNEIGTIQPLEHIVPIAREAGAVFHSDGVQAAGKIPIDLRALGPDLYALSGHKFYAMKGIGALVVRAGAKVHPILFGGRQERERRPGTENVAGAIALGRAAELARQNLASDSTRICALRDRLESAILDRVPDVRINGGRARRVPNTTNIVFEGIEGEAMVIALDLEGFAVSSGSACSSGTVEPSHVLLALGLSKEQARSSVRFSLGRSNTVEQVDALVEAVAACAERLRALSPTYSAHA